MKRKVFLFLIYSTVLTLSLFISGNVLGSVKEDVDPTSNDNLTIVSEFNSITKEYETKFSNREKITTNLHINFDEEIVKMNNSYRLNNALKKNNKPTKAMNSFDINLNNIGSNELKEINRNNSNKLKLTLYLDEEKDGLIEVDGYSTLSLENHKYYLKHHGYIEKKDLNGTFIYSGGLDSNIIDESLDTVLINIFISENKEILAKVTVGDFSSEDGIAFLKFGNEFAEQKMYEKQKKDDITIRKEQSNYDSISNEDEMVTVSNSSDWKYRNSASTKVVTDIINGRKEVAAHPVAVIETSSRTPGDLNSISGQHQIRIISNSAAARDAFLGSSYPVDVVRYYYEFYWNSRHVADIDRAIPRDSSSVLSASFKLFSSLYRGTGSGLLGAIENYINISSNKNKYSDSNGDGTYNKVTRDIWVKNGVKEWTGGERVDLSYKYNGGATYKILYDLINNVGFYATSKGRVYYNVNGHLVQTDMVTVVDWINAN